MWQQAVPVALVFCGLVAAALILVQQIGAWRYDVRLVQARRRRQRQPHARRYRQRPLITLIVPTHNDEAVMAGCLSNLTSNSYRKLQIIVADAGSQDDTLAIVQRFMADHPKKDIKLCAETNLSSATSAAYKTFEIHSQAGLVMMLWPTDVLDKQALAKAVTYFNDDDQLDAVLFSRMTAPNQTVTGLLQKYLDLLGQHSQKAHASISATPVLYRSQAFLAGQAERLYYASDVMVMAEPPTSLLAILRAQYRTHIQQARDISVSRRLFSLEGNIRDNLGKWFGLLLRFYLGVTTVLVPVLSGYFIYLAVNLHEPTLLLVSWAAAALFLAVAIWDNTQLRWYQKLNYTLGIPMTYGLLYILSLVQLVAQLRVAVFPVHLSHSEKPV